MVWRIAKKNGKLRLFYLRCGFNEWPGVHGNEFLLIHLLGKQNDPLPGGLDPFGKFFFRHPGYALQGMFTIEMQPDKRSNFIQMHTLGRIFGNR